MSWVGFDKLSSIADDLEISLTAIIVVLFFPNVLSVLGQGLTPLIEFEELRTNKLYLIVFSIFSYAYILLEQFFSNQL